MKAISIPFRFENGKVASTEDNAVIAKQRIIDVLATSKYERVMRPEYGAGVSSLLFEPLDPLILADYKVDALSEINDNVSNAKVLDIAFQTSGNFVYNTNDESTLVARVIYEVAGIGLSTFTFTVDTTQILTEETPIA
jgi:phage baseplate assembly protein W